MTSTFPRVQSGTLPQANVTTTIFISNLHCPSCIEVIRESLSGLDPAPELVTHSIVSHSVVLRHQTTLTLDDISGTLQAAGFEVHSIFQDDNAVYAPKVRHFRDRSTEWENSLKHAVTEWFRSSTPPVSRAGMHNREKHVEQCEQCRAEAGGVLLQIDDQERYSLKPNPTVTTEKVSLDDAILDSAVVSSPLVVVDAAHGSTMYKATVAISGMTCSSCVSSITHVVQQLPWVRSIDVNLLTHSATAVLQEKLGVDEVIETIEGAGFDATLELLEEVRSPTSKSNATRKVQSDRWRATYAIGGMTCSVCSGAITQALQAHNWIERVDINLVSNSGSIVFSEKDHYPQIKETIEDIGYEATLESIVSEDAVKEDAIDRSVDVRIGGMFCHHCPENIVRKLNEEYEERYKFHVELSLKDSPFSLLQPILRIRYVAEPPHFTIRHVFETIINLNQTFKPSVYHPPTIEDLARDMRAQERSRILFRLVLSILVAIPTFLLGIVFMSMINETNPIRHYIMQPMWAGNATRNNWALFILATPIYFLAADTFHRRAFKELKAMWRPGSRIPYLHRFLRFGSMNMLMSLGTSIAYFASVVELGLAASKKSSGSMTDSYFDAVVFLTMFLLIGRFLEAYSKAKTGDAVTSLGKLRPEEAILINLESGDLKIATDLLEVGDIVRVHHGTSPPFDGAVLEGSTNFDESSLTGESRPVKKEIGDTVYSGTVNKGSPVKVQITTIAGTSMLDQIIKAVREGQTKRAPVERVADAITSHFVPFVVLVAVLTWVVWLVLGTTGAIPQDWVNEGSGGWALWSLRFAIAVFVIACPCGIGLAAPTALFVGGGLAAKHGILVKGGGEAFQEASSLDCIVFDKTGTLTQGGDPAVTDHLFAGTQDRSTALGIVKALEDNSTHPIARAIVDLCNKNSPKQFEAVYVEEVPGKGLKGTFKIGEQEMTAIIGNEAFMADYHVVIPTDKASTLEIWKTRGESVALAAFNIAKAPKNNEELRYESLVSSAALDSVPALETEVQGAPVETWELASIFAIADALRPEAIGVIAQLKERGINVWMLSGDNPVTANAVGAQVGIASTNIIAGVLPDQKAEKIKYLQRTLTKSRSTSLFGLPSILTRERPPKRATIAMVGDGINDAPALSTADLSIAIGSGSDIAISSSSFILITSNLSSLLTLLDLSHTVFRRVYFNFGWALIYNIIAMPIAAGVLYPVTIGRNNMDMHHNGVGMEGGMGMGDSGIRHVRLDPVWASLAMAMSSVSVVCSSLLLRSRIPGVGFRVRTEDEKMKGTGVV